MSKPKQNLFYFDQEQEEQTPVVSNNSSGFSPSKTFTKQFHKIDDTNQLAKNFFQRDNNVDARAKEMILTNTAKKRIGKTSKLIIPAMAGETQKEQIKTKIDEKPRKVSEDKPKEESSLEEIKPADFKEKSIKHVFVSQSEEELEQANVVSESTQKQAKRVSKQQSDEENLQTHNQHQEQELQLKQAPVAEIVIKISPSDITDRKTFLTTQIEKGKVLECTLRRDKSGFSRFFPQYSLYTTDGVKYLMTSKKRTANTTSNYLVSLDKNDLSTKGDNYIGKVRSNWVGTEFLGFDSGYNPQKVQPGKQQRKQLCQIYYQSNFFGSKGPRVMNVYIPADSSFVKQKSALKQLSEKSEDKKVIHLVNKQPKWNPDTKTFVLNFNNRVDKPSVKNFILIDKSDPYINNTKYALLFGRISEDVFNLDVKYPLSPLQAFQIVISSFDYKLACE